MKISTGALDLTIRFGGGVPPLPGLDVPILEIVEPIVPAGEERAVDLGDEDVRGLAGSFDIGRVVSFLKA